jgi:hypothetical protein
LAITHTEQNFDLRFSGPKMSAYRSGGIRWQTLPK